MPLLPNTPFECLLTGASSGIGLAAAGRLLAGGSRLAPVQRLYAVARRASRSDALAALAAAHPGRALPLDVDLSDTTQLQGLAETLSHQQARPALVLHAAGLLHDDGVEPEKSISRVDAAALARVFAVNAFAPILLAQALWPLLRRRGPLLWASLSARVGSIGDNRLGGWYAYRASKAAHNQLIRTLAIELHRCNPQSCCLLLHPGTVDTPLSAPFQAGVPEARLFSPERAATQLLDLIAAAEASPQARFLAWDGSEIPW